MPISEVRKQVTSHFQQDEAMDDEDQGVGQGAAWRSRMYMVEIPPVAVNVIYRYRAEDGRVWSVTIAHGFGRYDGRIGEVHLGANVAQIESTLGKPARKTSIAPVIDQYVWEKGDVTYVVDAYSQDYDDIGTPARAGDVSSVMAYSRSLGPQGFVGYELPE